MAAMNFPKMEEEILKFWEDNKIFEKSVNKKAPHGDYVFYDGPPFATGTPHYGHIVASLMKDAVPRYFTMQGYRVERRWGWDCHGLPIENIVEQELNVTSKKDIEEKIGVDKFNELCRSKVLMFADVWKKFIPRIGRWVDMEHAYKTMDLDYMESIWWVFKQLWDKGLIYEGHKSMHICPRCETTLSQSEVSQGYKDTEDLAVVVKFALTDEPNTFVLAWTTTPWTLPGNVALAVSEDIDYSIWEITHTDTNKKEKIILASKTSTNTLKLPVDTRDLVVGAESVVGPPSHPPTKYKLLKEIKGKDLIGKPYEPLFPYFDSPENRERGFKIYAGDFVATEEGTGVVHIAPAFGEDDLKLGKKENLPFIQHVDFSGRFTLGVKDFAGDLVKPAANPWITDKKIVQWLEERGKLFSQEKHTHSYPFCWRCDTPLLNYSTSSWFVKVTAIKEKILKLAEKINWVPEHIKEGRFGKWLEGAEDWSISRQRYWGSVLPIWKCKCGEFHVLGSREELEKLSGQKVDDLHKHSVDKLILKCEKCGGEMRRVPDVLDCWFESGSMPYAQMHYPFENKKKFEENFPAKFIAEGVDQTRCWFYYLHVLSTAIMNDVAFLNVIANGIVLAESGQKMSKRLKNYPDPTEVIDRYGADALRYYLLTSPVMKADTLNFSVKGVDEMFKKLIMILWNVFSFYEMYAADEIKPVTKSKNILDQWIVSKLQILLQTVTEKMNAYDLVAANRPITDFVNDLSTWYLRRSRDRFKGDNEKDKKAALGTLKYVLLTLSKIIAPSIPFIAEKIYQELKGPEESVHLETWPKFEKKLVDQKILDQMDLAKKIVEAGLAARASAGIKIRQPLASYSTALTKTLDHEYARLVKEELNILDLKFGEDKLDTELTEELKAQGLIREIVRTVNALRKDAGLSIADRITLNFETTDPQTEKIIRDFEDKIKKETLSDKIEKGKTETPHQKEIEGGLWLGVKKI
ncbi:isoleucine--tRNA ligase [Candidatus Falkowbacteria bacterium]|nr:isoleucine--tRNA ligase [Candidatus Falkowbacteria bacterium]